MSATVTAPERIDVESSTRASIDVTESTSAEVRAFAERNDCEVHLERRGGRTYLVAVAE
ncbi:hypothetical protein [Halorarum halobium]|uniref:hypothetical protein n=1 Tax=Halorarum halobium TaxID=3075121 RepID=UPI0028A5F0B1|nr:hypothetical protein [Halobaculum sp. XH14]